MMVNLCPENFSLIRIGFEATAYLQEKNCPYCSPFKLEPSWPVGHDMTVDQRIFWVSRNIWVHVEENHLTSKCNIQSEEFMVAILTLNEEVQHLRNDFCWKTIHSSKRLTSLRWILVKESSKKLAANAFFFWGLEYFSKFCITNFLMRYCFPPSTHFLKAGRGIPSYLSCEKSGWDASTRGWWWKMGVRRRSRWGVRKISQRNHGKPGRKSRWWNFKCFFIFMPILFP